MPGISEILARLELVRRHRGYRSERAWCEVAGVSPTYISAIRVRGGPGGTGQVRDVKRETIAQLARAANIDLGWLLGEGPRLPIREAADTLPVEPAPSRTNFDEAFEAFDWPEQITAAQADEVRRRAIAEADATPTARTLPIKFWMNRLHQLALEVMQDKSRIRHKRGAGHGQ